MYSQPALSFFTDARKKRVWFVAFMFTDPDSQERKQFQFRGRINRFPDEDERISKGHAYATLLHSMLLEGWNPYKETPGQYSRRQLGGFVHRPKTIGECLKECYDIKMKQLTSQDAPRSYRYIYEHFTKWLKGQFLDSLRPDNFGAVHAMAYADQLTREGKRGRGFNNYRTVMKVFFNMLVTREVIARNPFAKVPPAKVKEAEIVPFQDAELRVIREHLIKHDYNLYVFCQLIFYLLLRPIEVLKLQVKHIDLTRGKINLPAAASKNSKMRSCNIPPALKTIINHWLKYESINDYLFGHGLKTCADKLVMRNSVTRRHKEVLDELKFEGRLSLYSHKYSGIVSAYLAGISIEEIRNQAGHSSIEITQIYLQKMALVKPSSFGSVEY